ncbi:MAG: tetratricopeptide repeat protein, partial [Syntrophorhabdaceae bacterium]|nr:tetratricopeptide repeat protein [Syntrophorhabdaceae bacterium]
FIKLHPEYPEVYFRRGRVLGSLGYSEMAIKDLTKAIELAPEMVDAYFLRAQLFKQIGKTEEAQNDIKKAIQIRQAKYNEDE